MHTSVRKQRQVFFSDFALYDVVQQSSDNSLFDLAVIRAI